MRIRPPEFETSIYDANRRRRPPCAAAARCRRKFVSGQLDEENPFVQNSSVLLVQADEGVSVLVVDRIGDIYRSLPRRADVIVTTVGARHKCQQGSGFEPPIGYVLCLIRVHVVSWFGRHHLRGEPLRNDQFWSFSCFGLQCPTSRLLPHRKVPLEDLIYTSCTDPIPQPAAARNPRLHQPSAVTHLFYAYLTVDCDDIIADVIIADPSTDSADVTAANPSCCLLILLTSSSP
ncbi:hypothetical protein F511_42964 [Dorcoceras hygrometricum]|uniref:Uncharacterized protein n=1 Tax=Dorcoceras hygrometricum TaxID=472368 RepID=A0A2Z7A3A7_9LAMI|nr:hypothetical protein F511_42964 [Dorcoceras hygrometricum]